MIYCTLKELPRYKGIHPTLDAAIDYLTTTNWQAFPEGRTEIDGDKLFLNRFDYDTTPEKDLPFETHLRYTDIHLLAAGQEQIATAALTSQQETERNEEKDYVFSMGEAEAVYNMSPDRVLIALPGEAHRGKGVVGTVGHVKKAVCKVELA